MDSLSVLKNLDTVINILIEIDNLYFEDLAISSDKSINTKNKNISDLITYIKKFYHEIIGSEIDEETIGLKDYFNLEKETDFITISELIAGIAAQCNNKKYYLEIMQNMLDEDDQNIMFNILSSRIVVKCESANNNEENHENLSEDKNTLVNKIELLENENQKLKISNDNWIEKYNKLLLTNSNLEHSYAELEQKYSELLISTNNADNKSVDSQKTEKNNQLEELVNLSIQLSEIKGKLEAKEQIIIKIKDEKEKTYMDLSKKILLLKQENDELKENNYKYEFLKEKYEKANKALDELNNYRNRNIHLEKLLKQSEEKIKILSNYENDKKKLLKKIEDLTFSLSEEKEKNSDLQIQKQQYYDLTVILESNLQSIKNIRRNSTAQDLKSNELNLSPADWASVKSKNVLSEIDNEILRKQLAELETKIKDLSSELDMVKKENTEYDEKIEEIKKDKDYYLKEIKELKKLIDRYKLFESERNRYENEANNLKIEYDTLKKDVSKKLMEVEGNYQKDIENLKTSLKSLETENNYLNEEVKKHKIYDSSTNSSKNFEANSNGVNYSSLSTKSSEETNLKHMLEKSNETIDHYKNEIIKREKLFEEQEIFLTNMIFNLSRELIFNRFINND